MEENYIEETIMKSNGEKLVKRYLKGALIGKGTDTEYFQVASLENSKIYAVKILPKSKLKKEKLKQRLKTEIRIQSKLTHPNVVKFEKCFEDSENLFVFYELCNNKNLLDLLKRRKRLTETEVKCYLAQLIAGVKYLHSLKIIHRDLRLNNLYLSENLELKIGDFSKAAKIEFEGERKKSILGIPNFMAPEVIDGSHSYEADIWSIGIILYSLLVGKPPFHTENTHETYSKIKTCSFDYPTSENISDPAKQAISQILVVDWQKRPNLDQILNLEFFTEMKSVPKLMGLATLVAPPLEKRANRRKSTHMLSDGITTEQFKAKMQGNVNCGHGVDGEVFVKKWIDYTWKYGLGYLMSNGNCGVNFIDSTRMVLNANTGQVFYMDKITIFEYGVNSYPEELKKKVTLLQYFKNYLESDLEISLSECDNRLPIYLKKWMLTRHALIFRLSSHLVQVNFKDQSELCLNCDSKSITFSNRKGEKLQMSLAKALLANNPEILRRLKYTRDALQHMLKFKV